MNIVTKIACAIIVLSFGTASAQNGSLISKPIRVVNGTVVTNAKEVIDTSTIASTAFFPPLVSSQIFGDKALGGAVVIVLKDSKINIPGLDLTLPIIKTASVSLRMRRNEDPILCPNGSFMALLSLFEIEELSSISLYDEPGAIKTFGEINGAGGRMYIHLKRALEEASDSLEIETIQALPSFKGGGLKDFGNWVARNLVYSEEAFRAGVQGTVIVRFAVTSEGKVEEIKVIDSSHTMLSSMAIKVVKSSPRWSPAIINKQPCKMNFQIPVLFALQ